MRVALIYGGQGYEREVSILGFAHLFPILNEIYETLPVLIDTDGSWLYKNQRVFPTIGGLYSIEGKEYFPLDCALPLLHGNMGEDGIIQGALEVAQIPYVGCRSAVGAICRDKAIVKAVARSEGIPTLPHRLLTAKDRPHTPCFIKPTCLGSSIGASAVTDDSELDSALKMAFSVCDRVIAEPLLPDKRELECGYFGIKGKELFTNPGEILTDSFYDYERKYKKHTKTRIKADLPERTADRIKDYSRQLVRALGVKQIARIDFFLSGDEIYFNEINTMPGFTESSLYHRMLEGAGLPIKELLCDLIEDCLC